MKIDLVTILQNLKERIYDSRPVKIGLKSSLELFNLQYTTAMVLTLKNFKVQFV